jgi:PAS domain S-box-containing protein
MIRQYEDQRLERLADLLVNYACLDFSQKATTSEKGDEVDAIALGLNIMAEELLEFREKEKKYIARISDLNAELEKKVADRTRLLTESEEKYRSIFHHNPLPMWVIDLDTLRFQDVNEAAIKHYGYSREEFLAMTALDIRPEEERARFLLLGRKSCCRPYSTGIWKHLKKDGSVIHADVNVCQMQLGNRPARLVISHDVTQQVRAGEELLKSEKLFRALIEKNEDMMALSLPDGTLLYCSPSITTVLGYMTEEFSQLKMYDVIHPDDFDREKIMEILNVPGKSTWLVQRMLHKDGSYRWCEGTVTNMLHDPDIRALVSNFRDITERKTSEELLQKALTRSNHAQKVAHVGHWEVDLQTRQSEWSDEVFRIYGLDPLKAVPSYDLFLSLVHPDDLERVKSIAGTSLKTLEPFNYFHRIIRPNGEVRHVLANGEYELDKNGKAVRLFGVAMDVTELKIKEAKLKESNKELETFIYRLSHDLRGPVASAKGLLKVVGAETGEEQTRRYMVMLEALAERQDYMLQNLLKVMKTRGKQLQLTAVEPLPLIKQVLSNLEHTEGFSRITINIACALDGPMRTDKELLYSILLNLVENSIKYRDREIANPEISFSIGVTENNRVVIRIADNGIGIPEHEKDHVFDMFHRATGEASGSGLGLYLVKNAMETLNAVITIEAGKEKGSAFVLDFPR